MPSLYTEHATRWRELSYIDYLGYFVTAWLAFNAWYRNAYPEGSDRQIINEIKLKPNLIRNRIIPLLQDTTEEASLFKSYVANLHNKLESTQQYCGQIRITFREVFIKEVRPLTVSKNDYGCNFEIVFGSAANQKDIISRVKNRKGVVIFELTQQRFDMTELTTHPHYIERLSQSRKNVLADMYRAANPRVTLNLLGENSPPISIGSYQFKCTESDLFAGILEIIYLMRCTLFHGELAPTKDNGACYEPAYFIIKKLLDCIN